jgi:hypothetical protein
MKGRQTFECIHCGLRVSGRQHTDGQIVADDRAPDNDLPRKPFVCSDCNAVGGNSAPADTRPGRHYRDERGFLVGPMICRRCGLQTGHGLLCACERKGERPNG